MKRIAISSCLLLMFLLVSQSIWAQAILRGKVQDADGKSLEFVNVGTSSGDKPVGTTTDSHGRYKLEIPSGQTVVVVFSAVGHAPFQYQVHLDRGEVKVYNVTLHQSFDQLPEMEVSAEVERHSQFTHIETQDLDQIVGPNAGVENLLKTLPDVSSNNEMSSQYSVRGGSFDENLVYINGVEVFRPQLIRSGQQEGMSIVNADLIDHLQFSPGGFDVTYGDKMSSVLDITYARPQEFKGKVSASLLGFTAAVQGLAGPQERISYAVGFRQHSNSYLFRSLDTKGAYTSNYVDLQALVGYRFNEHLDLNALSLFSGNRYGLVPESQTTMYGGFFNPMKYDAYFDGQELDRNTTALTALTLDYHPTEYFQLKWINSFQQNREREIYDIQTQYWIYQVNLGSSNDSVEQFERGVGTFLEHARNYLTTSVYSSELRGLHFARMGEWTWGVKWQLESISDRIREWKWVDSAGYAVPTTILPIGDPTNQPTNPILQQFCNANNRLYTNRLSAYLQRSLNFTTSGGDNLRLLVGLRGQYYSVLVDSTTLLRAQCANPSAVGSLTHAASHLLLSPRLSLSYRPMSDHDIVYRFAAGVYSQPPLYREYRHDDGSLNLDLKSQQSYQAMGTFDWNLRWADRPFRLTADLYYKYITNLIPYRIDNLRVRYDATNEAVAYATGLSLRMAGEFVPGIESWLSLSLMQTQEDLLTDTLGWLYRPTDQRFSVKLFFQDYLPSIPFWQMSMGFVFATGLPVNHPNQKDRTVDNRLPAYFRVDWGNNIELTRFDRIREAPFFRLFDQVLLGVEVFNLFDYRNTVSYIWVYDYENQPYHVSNYLTSRQINVKLTMSF